MARKLSVLILGIVAMAVPFAVGFSYILNHFYRHGAFLQDSGWIAWQLTATGMSQPLPPVLGNASFYAVHVAPLYWLIAHAAAVFPLGPPQVFALFMGLSQAMLAAAVFWVLTGPVRLRGAGVLLAAMLAIAFANSGLVLAVLRFPHAEILISAAILLFLVALHERRYGLASLFLLLALLTREDAGLHAAAILAVIVAARRVLGMERSAEAAMIRFLLLAVLYAAGAVILQRLLFDTPSTFSRIYAGVPSFGHLDWMLIPERLAGWMTYRTYVMLPAIVALLWALARHKPYIVAGYVAVLPWLALQIIAVAALPATLSGYYAFPLLIASFWPLLGALGDQRQATPHDRREILVGFTLMVAASFTALSLQQNPNRTGFRETFRLPPGPAEQRRVEAAVAALTAARGQLGAVLVDDGVASLAPAAFAYGETLWATPRARIDTAIHFERGFQAGDVRAAAARAGLSQTYRLPGTPVRVLSNRRLEDVAGLGAVPVPQ